MENDSTAQKLLLFIEHPLFWGPIGVIGGLVGLFFYTPILIVCGVCVLLAFHRAGVVSGKQKGAKIIAYIVLSVIVAFSLYALRVLIKTHAPDLGKDVAKEVIKAESEERKEDARTPPSESHGSSDSAIPAPSKSEKPNSTGQHFNLSLPIVVEFHVSNSHGPKEKFITIKNLGRVGIEDVQIEGIRYVFDRDAWMSKTLKLGFFSQLGTLATVPPLGPAMSSKPIDMGKIQIIKLYRFADSLDTAEKEPEPFRTFYCLRFTFRDERTKERLAFYKVTSAFYGSPTMIEEEGTAAGGGVFHSYQQDIPDVIKAAAKDFWGSEIKEYKPKTPSQVNISPSTEPLARVPTRQPEQFAFEEQSPDIFTVELYKGSRAIISRADLTEKGWGPFLLGNENPFSIFLENGNLYAEAKVYNGPGLPAVEVKKNDFVLRPMNWDRNFTDNALEIVNEKLQPVLQMIYKRKGLIHIQGIFSSPQGGAIYEAPELPQALPRIFKYPSWKYKGQYAEASDQDISPFARADNAEFVAFVKRWLTGPKPLLQIGNRNPGILHKEFMAFFYDKASLYRVELLRRLGKKGSLEIDGLYKSLDPQNPKSIKADDSNPAIFTRILDDIEMLTNELEAMSK